MTIISELPKGAEVLDLEAARVARAEARSEQGLGKPFIKITAGYIEVQPEIPLEAAFKLGENDIRAGLSLILADPKDLDELLTAGVSAQDLEAIVNFVTGKPLGE
jgi:hypothetical protein